MSIMEIPNPAAGSPESSAESEEYDCLDSPGGGITIAVTPDGRYATVNDHGFVLLDLENERILASSSSCNALILADGRRAMCWTEGYGDIRIGILDLTRLNTSAFRSEMRFTGCAMTSDGNKVFAAAKLCEGKRSIHVFDFRDTNLKQDLVIHLESDINLICCDPEGKGLFFADSSGNLWQKEIGTNAPPVNICSAFQHIGNISFLNSGGLLIDGWPGGSCVLDSKGMEGAQTTPRFLALPTRCAILPDGKSAICHPIEPLRSNNFGEMRSLVLDQTPPFMVPQGGWFSGFGRAPRCIHPSGRWLICFADFPDGKRMCVVNIITGAVSSIDCSSAGQHNQDPIISADGRLVFVVSNDSIVRVLDLGLDLRSEKCLTSLEIGERVESLCVSAKRDLLVVTTPNRILCYRLVNFPELDSLIVTAVKDAPNGKAVVTAPCCCRTFDVPKEVAGLIVAQTVDDARPSDFEAAGLRLCCPYCKTLLKLNPFFCTPPGLLPELPEERHL